MMLVIMLLFPLVCALLVGLLPWSNRMVVRLLGLLGTLGPFGITIDLWTSYGPGTGGLYQSELYTVSRAWFPQFLGARMELGVDGISLVFLILTVILTMLAVIYSWVHVRERERAYYACMLVLFASMLGVFVARDLLVFYLFWEAMLIPLYLLIGIWGGTRRIYASIKMVLYTLFGSLLMLVGIISLYWIQLRQSVTGSLSFHTLYSLQIDPAVGFWISLTFVLAFAIKTPLFPVHTWLPDAHVEAPSAGSVILAGILLKVGVYGFIRLLIPLFPLQALMWGGIMGLIAVIGILYGGMVAWAQEDIKKLVAYSSVSHLGFVVLGLFSLTVTSVTGGLLQGVIHGINTGALFLMVGMLYERIHTREIESIRGIANQLPVFAVFFGIFAFASIGLPGTNGFVGEFLILLGSFSTFPYLTVLASLGIIVAAIYMLSLLRKCLFGEISETMRGISDLNALEIIVLCPLVLLVFWIGLYPAPVIDRLQPTVRSVLANQIQRPGSTPAKPVLPGEGSSPGTTPAPVNDTPSTDGDTVPVAPEPESDTPAVSPGETSAPDTAETGSSTADTEPVLQQQTPQSDTGSQTPALERQTGDTR